MFQSISQTTPKTQVTTSFKTNQPITLVPETPFTVLVNGVLQSNQSVITANAGDTITAEVTTPNDYVWYNFYYYSINGVTSTFAVVNKSLFTIHVKEKDALLRWYLYFVTNHTLTYRSNSGISVPLKLGSKFDVIDEDVHVVLDPNSESVYFYNNFGLQLSKVQLPAAPLAYVKIPKKKTVVVLIFGGETYEIYLDSSKYGIAPLFARKNYSEFTETTYVTQSPTEDLISYLRRIRSRKAIPPATCLCYNGKYIWAGGNGSIWKVDPLNNFALLNVYDIDEYVLNITPLPNFSGALVVCQSQKVYTIDNNGNLTEIYKGTAVWEPALFNNKVFIPEGEIGYLKVYNPATQQFEDDILLNDFSPSYTTVVDNKLYVCGHDTENVLVFDSNLNQNVLSFPAKVTWISVVKDTYIVSHWLKDYKILDTRDLYRIVKIGFRNRSGPVTHIGTDENLVMTLGSSEVYAHTPRDSWLWLNGKRTYSNDLRGTALTDGDYIAMNFSAKVAGKSRTNCVIGDTAYDYDTEAYVETYFPRFIDLPIQRPQNQGIFTETIILPKYFSPTRMSIEFGSIKVNDAYYYGDTVVNPNDKVEIEINTRGNSALPVFTIGARQFVIPISTNITLISPVVSEKNQLDPGSSVEYQVEITVEGSKVDYIIPGYYDILVTKNDTNITGNYYQQFGKGDVLKVQFLSSQKKYDKRNVYILGGNINYEFIANNKLPVHIDYLDYGVLQYPNVRYSLNQETNNTVKLNLFDAKFFEESSNLYTTNTLEISGLDPNTTGTISISDKNSYFVLNGKLVTESTIQVTNGDTLALSRDVISYFERPINLTQTILSDDEDGYFEFAVGKWSIINRTIDNVELFAKFIQIKLPLQYENKKDNVDLVSVINNELNKIPVRKVFFNKEINDITTKIVAKSSLINLNETKKQLTADSNKVVLLRPTQRNVFSSVESFDEDTLLKDTPYSLVNDSDNILKDTPYSLVNDSDNILKDTPYSLVNDVDNSLTTNDINKVVLLKPRQRNVFSAVEHFTNENVLKETPYSLVNDVDNSLTTNDINKVVLSNPTQRNVFSVVENLIKTSFSLTKPYILLNNVENQTIIKPYILLNNVENQTIIKPYILLNNVENQLVFDPYMSLNNVESTLNTTNDINRVYLLNQTLFTTIGNKSCSNDLNTFNAKLAPNVIDDTSDVMNSGYIPAAYDNVNTLAENSSFIKIDNDYIVDMFNYLDYNFLNFSIIELNNLTKYLTEIHTNKNVDFKFASKILPEVNANHDLKNSLLPNIDVHFYFKNNTAPLAYHSEYFNEISKPFKYHHQFTKDKFIPTKNEIFYKSISTRFYKFILHDHFSALIEGAPALSSMYNDAGSLMYNLNYAAANYKHYFTSKTTAYSNKIANYFARLNPTFDIFKNEYKVDLDYYNLFRTAEWFSILRAERLSINYSIKKPPFENKRPNWLMPLPPIFDNIKLNGVKLPPTSFVPTTYSWVNTSILKHLLESDSYYYNKQDDVILFNEFVNYYILQSSSMKRDLTGLLDNDYDNFVKMDYIRKNDSINTQNSNTNYIHAPLSYLRSDITSEREVYPLLGLVNSVAEQYRQSQSDYSKYIWLREKPQYYYGTSITNPKFNQGELWDHDIETTYGAFLTAKDAVDAATKYQAFRPYLIDSTDLWTYRVLIDSNLVCPIRVRYPIAWLIRGG